MGYKITTVNELGCKWSVTKKKTDKQYLSLSFRKPNIFHFREKSDKKVVIEVDTLGFIKIDDDSGQAEILRDITNASLFRVHRDPFDTASDESIGFELIERQESEGKRKWLRHSNFMLRVDEEGVGRSFALDASFNVSEIKTASSEDPTGTPSRPTSRKRPSPGSTADETEFSDFKRRLAQIQVSLNNS